MSLRASKMKYILVRFLLTIAIMGPQPAAEADSNIVDEVQSYIRNIKSIAAEFYQTDAHGQSAKGMLIIDKPHKFRCNYYEPYPGVIIGNKNYVSFYDYELETLTRIDSKENIFNFLLIDNIDFRNKFEILSAKKVDDNYVIKIKSNEIDKISEIRFDRKTGFIKKMEIFEADNTITLIFNQINLIENVSADLFIIKDPDIFGKPARFSKSDLLKKYSIR